eukprot:CAMPEP_0194338510 /NCGR_PEP_ID=MMETSP0171-20130528/79869_1 /TAXON_ID=218684 /ORGANISM="Corethron pennatum, Strain L29A3" /LENGTH=175 /DNA_ID=CAMNT_0039102679 /DNA_START=14 /DNA_END=538 /DNA_ORIENTATION=+
MNFSSITAAFLLSGLHLVNADGTFYILRSEVSGYCASHEEIAKVTFAECDMRNLETKFLWQDQKVTTTHLGVSGTGSAHTGLILTFNGAKYAQPKKAFIALKKVSTRNKGIFKKSSWSNNGNQFYFANKDYFFSKKKCCGTQGVPMEKVILNANGEYEDSLIKKVYVMVNEDPPT